MVLDENLVVAMKTAARKVAANAYSPYSGFAVGAAVLASSGKIYAGCNIENVSYGLSICAERVAVFAALSDGERKIRALAVFTNTDGVTPPCGACLQVIAEFTDPDFKQGDIPILLFTKVKERWLSFNQLLPERFDKENINPNYKEKP